MEGKVHSPASMAALLVLAGIIAGCQSAPTKSPLIPPVPAISVRKLASQPQTIVVPKQWYVGWIPSASSNTATEVWMTTDLGRPFKLAGLTNGATWPMISPVSFYMVRARDTNTGAVSAWAGAPAHSFPVYRP